MSKKRGFTLTEVLVVIAITTLIMTMLGTTFVFMATSSGDLIHKSEELTQTQSIETYLRSLIEKKTYTLEDLRTDNKTDENKKVKINENTDLIIGTKIEFKDTGLESLEIYKNDNDQFVRCKMVYTKNNATYEFILGVIPEQQ